MRPGAAQGRPKVATRRRGVICSPICARRKQSKRVSSLGVSVVKCSSTRRSGPRRYRRASRFLVHRGATVQFQPGEHNRPGRGRGRRRRRRMSERSRHRRKGGSAAAAAPQEKLSFLIVCLSIAHTPHPSPPSPSSNTSNTYQETFRDAKRAYLLRSRPNAKKGLGDTKTSRRRPRQMRGSEASYAPVRCSSSPSCSCPFLRG